MMDFVFRHRAEPFPGGDFQAANVAAFALEVGVSEFGEDVHGLGVETFHKRENFGETGGKFRAVRGVTAGVALDIFGEKVAFGYGDVTQTDLRE